MNHHDPVLNRWFRYDSRCAACYLNHEHTHAKHCAAIASVQAQEVAAQAPGWHQQGYWKRVEEIDRIARTLLPTVIAETPLVDGAWE